MDWYYSADGKPVGPHSRDDVESLLLTGQISLETLVWREGMPQWIALSDDPELKFLVKPAVVPPPIPPVPPKCSVDLTPAFAIEGDEPFDAESGSQIDREPAKRPKPSSFYAEGGPWSRFFARLIDTVLFTLGLVVLASYALPYISPELSIRWATEVDKRVNYVVALPIAFILNGALMTAFGNSIGKAIFGLKVVPANYRVKLGLYENVGRELRVWIYGFALGIPIANLFTWWNGYKQVSVGKQPGYDIGKAHVRQSAGRFRILVGIAFAFVALGALATWNATADLEKQVLLVAQIWTNPVTGRSTNIPAGWFPEVVTGDDGAVLYTFTNLAGVLAMFGAEELVARVPDIKSYAEAIRTSTAGGVNLGSFSPSLEPPGLKANGRVLEGDYPATIYIAQRGTRYWRLILIDTNRKGVGAVSSPQLAAALWKTAGI